MAFILVSLLWKLSMCLIAITSAVSLLQAFLFAAEPSRVIVACCVAIGAGSSHDT